VTISAPPILGEEVLRPILDEFLTVHPSVSVRMLMHDRSVNLVDEGVDITLRIGALADKPALTDPADLSAGPGSRAALTIRSSLPDGRRRAGANPCKGRSLGFGRLHQPLVRAARAPCVTAPGPRSYEVPL